MKHRWLPYLATALLALTSSVMCSSSGDDDDDVGEAGDGGEPGNAGSGGGGRAGGGSSGDAGDTSTPGASGAGGSADPGLGCEPGGGPISTPAETCQFEDPDPCLACLSASCCSELMNCYGTDPANVCGYGGPNGETEYLCIRQCLEARATAGGGAYDREVDDPECAAECVTIVDGSACSAIGNYTSVLVGCMHDSCEDECILDPAM